MSMSFRMKVEVGYFCPACEQWFMGKPTEAWMFNAEDQIPGDLKISKDWNYALREDTDTLVGDKVVICHDSPACVSSEYDIEDYTPAVAGAIQCTECDYQQTYDDADLTRFVLAQHGMEDHFDAAYNISLTVTTNSQERTAVRRVEQHFLNKHPVQAAIMSLGEKAELANATKNNDV